MKQIVLGLLVFLYSISALGQHSLVSNNENIIYVGLPKAINFLVQKYPCDKFILVVDSASIQPTDDACCYIITANAPGKIKVSVQNKKTGKIVDVFIFIAKVLPPPVVKLSGRKGGEISAGLLKAQRGLIIVLEGFDLEARYEVLSFSVIIVRDKQVVFYHENLGVMFEREVKNEFQHLQTNDKIIFASVKYRELNGENGDLKAAEYFIGK